MEIDLEQFERLVDILGSSNLAEITVEKGDQKITLRKTISGEFTESTSFDGGKTEGANLQSPENVNQSKSSKSTGSPASTTEVAVTSPIVGTFYRSPSPEEPPYVEVGDTVEEGDTVCIVEAMKVMNEVQADADGEIVEICVEDGTPVEYGEDLFRLEPQESSSE